MQLSQLQRRVESCCCNPDSATGAPARAVNPSTSVSDVRAASPSKLQGDVIGRLAGHLVKSLSDGDKLEVKTCCRGQPMVFYRAPTSRMPSDLASAESMRRRSVKLTEVSLELIVDTVEAVRVQDAAGRIGLLKVNKISC